MVRDGRVGRQSGRYGIRMAVNRLDAPVNDVLDPLK
jgi:hypothetical protein